MALVNEQCKILGNNCVGPNLHLMTLSSPEIAAAVQPGQFVHMQIPRMESHILRRPFSIYAADAINGTVDILYQVVGFGSEHMTSLQVGEVAEMIGPIGRGWLPPQDIKRALIVGGGVGAAPVFMLTEQLVAAGVEVEVVLGAQTEQALVTRARYEELLGRNPLCATDDGSYGRSGFCTSLVEEALADNSYDYLAVCGPEPLMKIVARMADAADVPAEISMEKRMACGVGACLSCVVDTVEGKKRSCVDGPVFGSKEIVW